MCIPNMTWLGSEREKSERKILRMLRGIDQIDTKGIDVDIKPR